MDTFCIIFLELKWSKGKFALLIILFRPDIAVCGYFEMSK